MPNGSVAQRVQNLNSAMWLHCLPLRECSPIDIQTVRSQGMSGKAPTELPASQLSQDTRCRSKSNAHRAKPAATNRPAGWTCQRMTPAKPHAAAPQRRSRYHQAINRKTTKMGRIEGGQILRCRMTDRGFKET